GTKPPPPVHDRDAAPARGRECLPRPRPAPNGRPRAAAAGQRRAAGHAESRRAVRLAPRGGRARGRAPGGAAGRGSARGGTGGERLAWRRWAPLVVILPGLDAWTAEERRALAAVIRAKGGAFESEFVESFDRHRRLRHAVRTLAESLPA